MKNKIKAWDRPPNSTIPNRPGDKEETPIFTALGKAVSAWEGVSVASANLYASLLGYRNSKGMERDIEKFSTINGVHDRAKQIQEKGEQFLAADFTAPEEDIAAFESGLKKILEFYRGWTERRNDLAHGYVTDSHGPDYENENQPSITTYSLCPSHARSTKWPGAQPIYNYIASEIEFFAGKFKELDDDIEKLALRADELRKLRVPKP